jgi:hypothetical protein
MDVTDKEKVHLPQMNKILEVPRSNAKKEVLMYR